MVSFIDADVGKIIALLKERNIEKNTLVLFTSANRAAKRWEGTFDSSGKPSGRKRDVYEGGIRVPMIVYMSGSVPENKVNHCIGYFADIILTFIKISGQNVTLKTDGIDLQNVFLANYSTDESRVLYREFHKHSGKQAGRKGNWKAIRLDVHEKGFHNEIELYNLENDPSETNDVAADHP